MPQGIITFQLISVVLATAATILVLFLLLARRHVIIKPTFFVGLFATLSSWSAVAYASQAYSFLAEPWPFLWVTQVTAIVLLVISTFSVDRSARGIWDIATSVPAYRYLALKRVIPIVLGLSVACIAIYFIYVRPWQTGLWVAIAHGDVLLSREARESSLKLLSAFPRYVFSLNRDVLTRFAAAALVLIAVARWKVRGQRVFILIPVLLLCLAASASLYGARGPAGLVIAAALLAFYFYKKAPLRLSYVVIGFGLVVLLPTAISLMRGGGELSLKGLWGEFTNTIAHRVFGTQSEVGIWHMDYVQRYGYWGISGISKLAPLFNIEPVNVDNLIMNEYHHSTPTGLATTGSFITNYTRWGLVGGMLFSIVSVWLLDLILPVFRRVTPAMLLASLCIFLMATRGVLASNIETVLITRGLVPGLVLIWFLNGLVRADDERQESRYADAAQLASTPEDVEWGYAAECDR